jgi:hypothetical protein
VNPNSRLAFVGGIVMVLGAKVADGAHTPVLFWVGVVLAAAGFVAGILGLFRKWWHERA